MVVNVFKHILFYIYSGVVPEDEIAIKHGKELLDAANRFDLSELKISVENILVGRRTVNKENVSDWILFAESHSCPLMKEYAVSYLALHAKEVLASEHSKRLRESAELLSEIIVLTNNTNADDMTVTQLRGS